MARCSGRAPVPAVRASRREVIGAASCELLTACCLPLIPPAAGWCSLDGSQGVGVFVDGAGAGVQGGVVAGRAV